MVIDTKTKTFSYINNQNIIHIGSNHEEFKKSFDKKSIDYFRKNFGEEHKEKIKELQSAIKQFKFNELVTIFKNMELYIQSGSPNKYEDFEVFLKLNTIQ